MSIRFRAGFHLGNWGSGPSGETLRLIEESKPGALLCMENVQPAPVVEEWAKANPDGYLILRKHFAHSGGEGEYPTEGAVINWANGQCKMLENYLKHRHIRELYEKRRLGVKVFNEPNFSFEGFGQSQAAIRAYADLYPVAANYIKQRFPKVNRIGMSLAPGNQDVYFLGDETGPEAHYWFHGPEASKGDPTNPSHPDNPTPAEIEAAKRSAILADTWQHMDWLGVHVYPLPGTWNTLWLGRRFEQYWKFVPDHLRNNTFILEASVADDAGQQVRAHELALWLQMLQTKPGIRGVTLWWLRPGDITWERHFYTDPSGRWRPVAYVVRDFNLQFQTPQPEPEQPEPEQPEPEQPEPEPEPDVVWDPKIIPLERHTPDVAPGELYWRATKVVALSPKETGGTNICWVRTFANGTRLVGQPVRWSWGGNFPYADGSVEGNTEEKPLSERGDINFGIYSSGWSLEDGPGPYWVEVADEIPSEIIRGMGLPSNHHWSFQIEFTLVRKEEQGEVKDLESTLVGLAKENQKMSHNSQAALTKVAVLYGYTIQLSDEFTLEDGDTVYVAQLWAHPRTGNEIVTYARVGDWGNVRTIAVKS